MIIQNGQRSHAPVEPLGAFEIHLPEFVRLRSFETLERSVWPIFSLDQTFAVQDTLQGRDRNTRQLGMGLGDDTPQFPGAPIGTLPAGRLEGGHHRLAGLLRTVMRPAAMLVD